MIKRTLFFGNPAYLSTRNEQLIVNLLASDKPQKTIPIEDIGVIVLEHPQITITSGLVSKLLAHKCLLIHCDANHLPAGILQPLTGHTLLSERLKKQIAMSEPLKKNLWQQTIQAKINNQAQHLEQRQKNALKLRRWAKEVKSGDSEHHEAYAAAYYFQELFNENLYTRNDKDQPPNHWLNYGYAILRALTARAIISSGLLPTLGIFHSNKYNAYALADDLMEPYRPFVDNLVCEMVCTYGFTDDLDTQHKAQLLKIPIVDTLVEGKKSPLMIALSRTTSSLYDCIDGSKRKIIYPTFCKNE